MEKTNDGAIFGSIFNIYLLMLLKTDAYKVISTPATSTKLRSNPAYLVAKGPALGVFGVVRPCSTAPCPLDERSTSSDARDLLRVSTLNQLTTHSGSPMWRVTIDRNAARPMPS
jgi:hypothetical protein